MKFFRAPDASRPLLMATGGTDGHVRVWRLDDLLVACPGTSGSGGEAREMEQSVQPEVEFSAGMEPIDYVDASRCGEVLAVVTSREASLWCAGDGQRILTVGSPPQLDPKEFKVG